MSPSSLRASKLAVGMLQRGRPWFVVFKTASSSEIKEPLFNH